MEIPAQGDVNSDDTILMYGHLDKQPEMTGWAEGLGPWIPVIRDEKLYGSGGADDGYAAYSSLAAIMAVQKQGLPHARIVVIIEACEESGSYDLPFYIDHLKEQIGTPSLVICLDSGAGNYEQLWLDGLVTRYGCGNPESRRAERRRSFRLRFGCCAFQFSDSAAIDEQA